MSKLAILHVCPHCHRVFDSPSWCVDGDCETEPTPQTVSDQQWLEMPRAECDGSGGFGPPKGSGLLGWIACPGCPACRAAAFTRNEGPNA
jgi:hypothetical protein